METRSKGVRIAREGKIAGVLEVEGVVKRR